MEILDFLTEEQRSAVLDFDHNLLILACAGSGKTRTITGKIAYTISEKILRPRNIVAVTFTNRAANEMSERIHSILPDEDLAGLEIRTFHSLGAYILRRFGTKKNLSRDFCIYDENDCVSLLSSRFRMDKRELKNIVKDILGAKDRGLTPDEIAADGISEYFRTYQEALVSTGNVDFADLISLSTELLNEDDEVRSYFHGRFKMILVDEYQDSNRMQYLFLRALAGPGTQVVAVGDDDQSIYSFRGADVSNILTFEKCFENVRRVTLDKNFRSTTEILSFAHDVISKNQNRYDKGLVSAYGKHGPKPMLIQALTDRDEAALVSYRVSELGDYQNTAILYRTNAQSQLFEQHLTRLSVPYTVVGGLRFYEREEIKDSLAFLYILMNHRDEVSFRRIINKPKRGLGEAKIKKILSLNGDIRDALEEFSATSDTALVFLRAWDRAEKSLAEGVPVAEVLQRGLSDSGILDYYGNESDEAVRKTKLDNLGQMISSLTDCFGKEGLGEYLERIVLDSNSGEEDSKGVSLMTMHNTKGLEFDNVFVVGVEDEYLPGIGTEEEEEEERRILYVACTRAGKRLILTAASMRSVWGKPERRFLSRFIIGLNPELFTSRTSGIYRSSGNRAPVHSTPKKIKEPEEINPEGTFAEGDAVKSREYGNGAVIEVISTEDGKRILTVMFGERRVKLVEKYARIEKL